MKKIIPYLIIIVTISSCRTSDNFSASKRRYSSGYYFEHIASKKAVKAIPEKAPAEMISTARNTSSENTGKASNELAGKHDFETSNSGYATVKYSITKNVSIGRRVLVENGYNENDLPASDGLNLKTRKIESVKKHGLVDMFSGGGSSVIGLAILLLLLLVLGVFLLASTASGGALYYLGLMLVWMTLLVLPGLLLVGLFA
jgi:hypothetical protein